MLEWIEASERVFQNDLKTKTVGFRSPAGIITPPLIWALKKRQMPLIHWNHRFFDTRFEWTKVKALRSLKYTKGGSIILLHDCHEGSRREEFLETLACYIETALSRGFEFCSIILESTQEEG